MSGPPDALIARPPGATVGRYEICRKLAVGGMATVYLARMLGPAGFQKLVALKCMHPHLIGQPDFLERFYDEARLISRVNHPNVCSILDFGLDGGVYFIALELLMGRTLAQMRQTLASESDLGLGLTIVAGAGRGLHSAHELVDGTGARLGVVHRDVSPDNIFVTFDGDIKLIDFGVAKAGDQLHLTRTRTVLGKFSYMAPEQLRGEPVDRRADVWSLGVVAWELVTGRRLFRRATEAATMEAVLNESIAPPSAGGDDSRLRSLDAVILRALEREPGRRFDTVHALVEGIEATGLASLHREQRGAFMKTRFCREHAEMMGFARAAKALRSTVARPVGPQSSVTAQLVTDAPPARQQNRRFWSRRAVTVGALMLAGVGALVAGALWSNAPRVPARPLPTAIESASAPRTERSPAATSRSSARIGSKPDRGEPSSSPTAVAAPARSPPGEKPSRTAIPVTTSARSPTTSDRPAARSTSRVSAAADGLKREPPTRRKEARPKRKPDRPRSARSTVAARPAAQGRLNVSTPGGWADVYVDGARQGRTPIRIDVPVGRHRVELRIFGRKAEFRSVDVREGQVSRLVLPVADSK